MKTSGNKIILSMRLHASNMQKKNHFDFTIWHCVFRSEEKKRITTIKNAINIIVQIITTTNNNNNNNRIR